MVFLDKIVEIGVVGHGTDLDLPVFFSLLSKYVLGSVELGVVVGVGISRVRENLEGYLVLGGVLATYDNDPGVFRVVDYVVLLKTAGVLGERVAAGDVFLLDQGSLDLPPLLPESLDPFRSVVLDHLEWLFALVFLYVLFLPEVGPTVDQLVPKSGLSFHPLSFY